MVWEGKREEGSGWGTHAYLWQIHFYIWQNQYNYVKFKNKIKFKKKRIAKILFIEQKYYLKIPGLQECYKSVPPSLVHVYI